MVSQKLIRVLIELRKIKTSQRFVGALKDTKRMLIFFFAADVDECKKNPCLNGGTCVNNMGSFHCLCRPGFEGKLCERGKKTDNHWKNWNVVTLSSFSRPRGFSRSRNILKIVSNYLLWEEVTSKYHFSHRVLRPKKSRNIPRKRLEPTLGSIFKIIFIILWLEKQFRIQPSEVKIHSLSSISDSQHKHLEWAICTRVKYVLMLTLFLNSTST